MELPALLRNALHPEISQALPLAFKDAQLGSKN
jgi:hypothetical protein